MKMKWSVLVLSLAASWKFAGAEEIPAVDPNTPPAIVALVDGLHLGDNGSVLMLRDVQNGVYGVGSSSTFYKKYYLSSDVLVGYIPSVPGANGFYAINGRAWVGQFLYEKVPYVKEYADATGLAARMLQYGTVGYWGARDFQYGIWRHGWDLGVTIKF